MVTPNSPDSPLLPRLFVIGDSISIQYGPYLEKQLTGKMRYNRKRDTATTKALANLDNPVGANGGDSSMVLAYLRACREAVFLEAEVLMLNCGLHDIKTQLTTGVRQISLAQYRKNLRAILAEAMTMADQVLWVRTTPVINEIHNKPTMDFHRHASDVAAYNEVADKVMREAGVPLLDLHAFSKPFLPAAYIDHVHFNEEVRQKQGEFLAAEILRLTAKKIVG